MKTTTKYLHYYFCEYSEEGVSYVLLDQKSDNKDNHYLNEVEVPVISKDEVTRAGINRLDNEIVDLLDKVEEKREKKQQLLAIEFKGDE